MKLRQSLIKSSNKEGDNCSIVTKTRTKTMSKAKAKTRAKENHNRSDVEGVRVPILIEIVSAHIYQEEVDASLKLHDDEMRMDTNHNIEEHQDKDKDKEQNKKQKQAPAIREKKLNTYCVVEDLPYESSGYSGSLQDSRESASTSNAHGHVQPLHKTKVIKKDNHPIWTVKTDSLYLLHVLTNGSDDDGKDSEDDATAIATRDLNEGKIGFELFHRDAIVGKALSMSMGVTSAMVNKGKGKGANKHMGEMSLGRVTLTKKELLEGDGSRRDFDLIRGDVHGDMAKVANTKMKTAKSQRGLNPLGGLGISKKLASVRKLVPFQSQRRSRRAHSGTLALRFRRAEPHEVEFMMEREVSVSSSPVANSIMSVKTFARDKNELNDIAVNREMDAEADSLSTSVTSATDSTSPTKKKLKWKLKSKNVKKVGKGLISNPMERGMKQMRILGASITNKKEDLKYKVKPYADPFHREQTKYMTSKDIDAMAFEPSRNWIKLWGADVSKNLKESKAHILRGDDADANVGISAKEDVAGASIGTLRVEILQCDGLPNLDTGALGDLTDSFVAMVFENNVVRTDEVMDELSPRFMPWTQRAFAFPIQHPSSLLFLGVFDYDAMGDNDPIGRVVVDLSKLVENTEYLLTYKLYADTDQKEECGKLTIRLSLDWLSKGITLKRAMTSPPAMRVNVPDKKALRVVRYLTRGKIDMQEATIASISEYAYELIDHLDQLYYVIDLIIRIILWRGSLNISVVDQESTDPSGRKEITVWFPTMSVVVFLSTMLVLNRPSLIPSMFFFFIAAIMYFICYNRSANPSPWKRCMSVKNYVLSLIGGEDNIDVRIEASEGHALSLSREKLELARINRVKEVVYSLLMAAYKVYDENAKLDPSYYLLATEDKKGLGILGIDMMGFAKDPLWYLHVTFGTVCYLLRVVRGIVSWDSYHNSFTLMVYCVLLGLGFLILPLNWLLSWTCRLAAFAFLGPWMKWFDIKYVMPYYPLPNDEGKVEFIEPNYDEILFKSDVHKKKVLTTKEDAMKLKDMRDYLFGKFMEIVPALDSSRYPSIPEPTSTAKPCRDEINFNRITWEDLPGQRLKGKDGMVPHMGKVKKEKIL